TLMHRTRRRGLALALIVAPAWVASAQEGDPVTARRRSQPAASPPAASQPAGQRVGDTLENVMVLPGGVINGSAPSTPGDFAALRALGVQTVVAVDGAYPNADLAAEYGMRYVHLPISYDEIPAQR